MHSGELGLHSNANLQNEIENPETLEELDYFDGFDEFAATSLHKARAKKRAERIDNTEKIEKNKKKQKKERQLYKNDEDMFYVSKKERLSTENPKNAARAAYQEYYDDTEESEEDRYQEAMRKYGDLIEIIDEDQESLQDLVAVKDSFSQCKTRKEQLDCISELSVTDLTRLFSSDLFGDNNRKMFFKTLRNNDMRSELISAHRDGYEHTLEHEKKFAKAGIYRTAFHAMMIGTPEYASYRIAQARQPELVEKIFPSRIGDAGSASKAIWYRILDSYSQSADYIAKTNPELAGEELEKRQVRYAGKILEKTAEIMDSHYTASFELSDIFARLGDNDGVRRLWGLLEKTDYGGIKLDKISRFIGRNGVSRRTRKLNDGIHAVYGQLQHLEYLIENPDNTAELMDNGAKAQLTLSEFLERENQLSIDRASKKHDEIIDKIRHRYEKKISSSYDPERKSALREELDIKIVEENSDFDAKKEYFENRTASQLKEDLEFDYEKLKNKREKHRTVLEKAIDLHMAGDPQRHKYDTNGVDWVGSVSFGDIRRAYKRLKAGASYEEIEEGYYKNLFDQVVPGALSDDEIRRRIKDNRESSIDIADLLLFSINADQDSYYYVNDEPYNRSEIREFLRLSSNTGKAIDIFNYGLRGLDRVTRHNIGSKDDREVKIELASKLSSLSWVTPSNCKEFLSFPFEDGDKARYHWFAKENGVIDFSGFGWSPQVIGKLIQSRLENRVGNSMNGVIGWLERAFDEDAMYDIKNIKNDIKNGNKKSLEEYKIKIADPTLEKDLLYRLLYSDDGSFKKLKLPTKSSKISRLFSSDKNMHFYNTILSCKRDGRKIIGENDKVNPFFVNRLADELKRNNNRPESIQKIRQEAVALIEEISEQSVGSTDKDVVHSISTSINDLYKLSDTRKNCIDDLTKWATRHAMVPSITLEQAWKNRAKAIYLGCDDNARSIIKFERTSGFKEYLSTNWQTFDKKDQSPEEYFAEHEAFIHGLITSDGNGEEDNDGGYSFSTVLYALKQFDKIKNPNKVLPPAQYALETHNNKYAAEVLSYDSPSGYMIGIETGCCMRLGREAESCVTQGYSDSNAGFFALRERNGRMVAQSFFYVNPSKPDVLVLDNIEAGEGRDAGAVIDSYQEFFRKYLVQQFKQNPDWKIREVHVGTNYGEIVQPLVRRLPVTEIVPNHNKDTYTDADEDQRLLLLLSREEIKNASQAKTPQSIEIKPNHEPYESIDPLNRSQAEMLKYLESEIYPENMREFDDDFLDEELLNPGVEDYSFIIKSGSSGLQSPVGYCLAYEADSETDVTYPEKCIYVSDFGLMENSRAGFAALKAFRELVGRAKENGVKKIEMSARESTSYKLLTNPVAKRFLKNLGFEVSEYGVDQNFGGNEQTHLISLDAV